MDGGWGGGVVVVVVALEDVQFYAKLKRDLTQKLFKAKQVVT